MLGTHQVCEKCWIGALSHQAFVAELMQAHTDPAIPQAAFKSRQWRYQSPSNLHVLDDEFMAI